jgi:hypothetical protein
MYLEGSQRAQRGKACQNIWIMGRGPRRAPACEARHCATAPARFGASASSARAASRQLGSSSPHSSGSARPSFSSSSAQHRLKVLAEVHHASV